MLFFLSLRSFLVLQNIFIALPEALLNSFESHFYPDEYNLNQIETKHNQFLTLFQF